MCNYRVGFGVCCNFTKIYNDWKHKLQQRMQWRQAHLKKKWNVERIENEWTKEEKNLNSKWSEKRKTRAVGIIWLALDFQVYMLDMISLDTILSFGKVNITTRHYSLYFQFDYIFFRRLLCNFFLNMFWLTSYRNVEIIIFGFPV